jgi:AcrR family transcriptional regulator
VTPPDTTAADAPTRSYDSSRRRQAAAATRLDVLASATRLFTERGWAGTSVRDIAKEARVSVETVYSAVGAKAEVLRQALNISVVGDDEPVPLADRPEFRALAEGSPAERAAAVGDLLAVIMPRTAALGRAVEHGAAADPALAEVHAWALGTQRESTRQALVLLTGREPSVAEADAAHAMFSNAVYLQLTEFAGWSTAEYRDWVVDIALRLFLGEDRG